MLENEALMKRRDLIDKGTNSKDSRVKDCSLYIRKNNQWAKVESDLHGQGERVLTNNDDEFTSAQRPKHPGD